MQMGDSSLDFSVTSNVFRNLGAYDTLIDQVRAQLLVVRHTIQNWTLHLLVAHAITFVRRNAGLDSISNV